MEIYIPTALTTALDLSKSKALAMVSQFQHRLSEIASFPLSTPGGAKMMMEEVIKRLDNWIDNDHSFHNRPIRRDWGRSPDDG
jgi:hypothetical protein